MAFGDKTVWEVRTTGDDTNFGGGFDTGATFATDLTTDANTGNTATPVVSTASYNFVAGDVGAWLFIKSGTNWITGWYQITAVSSNKATVNATVGSAILHTANSTVHKLSDTVGVATVGTPTNGSWGIDYSQQDQQQFASSTFAIGNPTTTQLTDGTNTIGKNWVGNIISITAGTGFTVQRVAVTSTSGTTATVDKTLGVAGSTNGTGKLGGALATPGLAGSFATATNNTVMIKTGTYSITSATANIAGGCVSGVFHIQGYGTKRWDLTSPPTLQASGINTFTLVAMTSNGDNKTINLILDGATATSSRGLGANRGLAFKVAGINCTNGGIAQVNNICISVLCRTTGCSTQTAFSGAGSFIACESYNNTITGFATTAGSAHFLHCLSYGNSGSSSDGFIFNNGQCSINNCVAYNNGRDGYRLGGADLTLTDCIAEGNTAVGAVGFNANFGSAPTISITNCAAYNNTTNFALNTNNCSDVGSITGTSSFFVNAAGGNFALSGTSTGGALLRRAGTVGVFPAGTTTGYLDIGAAQTFVGPARIARR